MNGTAGVGEPVPDQIQIVQTTFDPEQQLFVVSYSSGYTNGVDVYYSDDLENWTFDGKEDDSGVGLNFTRESHNPSMFYALVKPGGAFPAP